MSNRFIICGASRSGKSVLARRLQRELEVSWILGDAMVSGLQDASHDQINKSRELRESCAEFGIPYVEVSHDFELDLEKAERILGVGARPR